MGQANAYMRADTRDLVIRGIRAIGNRRYGIHIDGQHLVGREPRDPSPGAGLRTAAGRPCASTSRTWPVPPSCET
jgi:hypothetical protein